MFASPRHLQAKQSSTRGPTDRHMRRGCRCCSMRNSRPRCINWSWSVSPSSGVRFVDIGCEGESLVVAALSVLLSSAKNSCILTCAFMVDCLVCLLRRKSTKSDQLQASVTSTTHLVTPSSSFTLLAAPLNALD